MTTASTTTAVLLGLRSRFRPTHHRVNSPQAPHAKRIGPTNAALTPLDSNNRGTKVYTVNCPRNENKFDADIAASAPRPASTESPATGPLSKPGHNRLASTNGTRHNASR